MGHPATERFVSKIVIGYQYHWTEVARRGGPLGSYGSVHAKLNIYGRSPRSMNRALLVNSISLSGKGTNKELYKFLVAPTFQEVR